MEVEVIVPPSLKPKPTVQELRVAHLFAQHYKATVEFLEPHKGYKQKTPDFIADGLLWEIKSPKGISKTTIRSTLKSAAKQSANIVIDSRNTKIPDDTVIKDILKEVILRKRVSKVILVSKENKVIEVYFKK